MIQLTRDTRPMYMRDLKITEAERLRRRIRDRLGRAFAAYPTSSAIRMLRAQVYAIPGFADLRAALANGTAARDVVMRFASFRQQQHRADRQAWYAAGGYLP